MNTKPSQPSVGTSSIAEDYSSFLKKHDIQYQVIAPYYHIGQIENTQGWILHMSSTRIHIANLLNVVLPILKSHKVPFKIPQSLGVVVALCDGALGYYQLGKVITIYPCNDEKAALLAKELLEHTKDFEGCNIPTDFHLRGILYTRYGGFNPVLHQNDNGQLEKYIKGINDQLVKDEYHSPFQFPKGIHWPFNEIKAAKREVPTTFLKDKYKVFQTLKTDAKGRVMKSLRFKGVWVQWVIIKEAIHDVFVDSSGRDNRDRLQWQYRLQSELKGKILTPEVYDFFEENGNTYLVMEYIKGKSLSDIINTIYRSKVWFDLDEDKKKSLLDHLLQLVDSLELMHRYGYIHRDINPVNFIVNRQNKVVAIDLELAYSIKEQFPSPPFTLGTPGFISPEQASVQTPKVKQDIYSLGAMMIRFFTGLSPSKFDHTSPSLADRLNFFIRNRTVSLLIQDCLNSDPSSRPVLSTIKTTLEKFKGQLITADPIQQATPQAVKKTINKAIDTLAQPLMALPERIWHSPVIQNNEALDNVQTGMNYQVGFYTGVSGIMYALAEAKKAGHELGANRTIYARSLNYLNTYFFANLPNVLPGLYHGAAGVAMALNKGIETQLIDVSYKSTIEKCLDIPLNGLSMAYGVSGQGLALLTCKKALSSEVVERILEQHVNLLLARQQKDGSWLTVNPGQRQSLCYTGFSHGAAGCCYFLLEYYQHFRDDRVLKAIQKALQWLMKHPKKTKYGIYWGFSNDDKRSNPWLHEGTAGIALCFTKAFQTMGDAAYKKIAERAFYSIPEKIVHSDFTMFNGISGLARVYLISADILGNPEWHERADFIIDSLLKVYLSDAEHYCFWMTQEGKTPTADFMIGNSGIMHLLSCYLSTEKREVIF